jgi:hypothetical protein
MGPLHIWTIDIYPCTHRLGGRATVIFKIGIGDNESRYRKDPAPWDVISAHIAEEIRRRIELVESATIVIERYRVPQDEKDLGRGRQYCVNFDFACRRGESFSEAALRTFKNILTAFGFRSVPTGRVRMTQETYVRYRGKWMTYAEHLLLKNGLTRIEDIHETIQITI